MSTLPLIEKIHFLESKLGERWIHPILEPFKFDSSDVIRVQEAGKKIAQHLGLPQLTFIITYAQQESNVGGHINLDYSQDVFVEIDSKFKNDNEFVLAILAHEICHKYLHLNNLKLFPDIENEMLTDAATIYTGLGKLSLNGCEKTSYSTSTSGNTTTTTTTTQKVGYMNRLQFAFVYRLVCEMRRISQGEMMTGLSEEAADVVSSVGLISSFYFNERYFSNKLTLQTISDSFKNDIGESQKNIAKFNRHIREIQEIILPTAIHLAKEFHSYTKSKIDPLIQLATKPVNREPHAYIKNLLALEEFEFYKPQITEKERALRTFGTTLQLLITHLNGFYSKQLVGKNMDFLFQFECPLCANMMRIQEKKLARVKCQKCNHSFIVDTGIEHTETIEPKINVGKKGFWARIKSFFKT